MGDRPEGSIITSCDDVVGSLPDTAVTHTGRVIITWWLPTVTKERALAAPRRARAPRPVLDPSYTY
jgi:hypothetical protein